LTISLLEKADQASIEDYNPSYIIQAVNSLMPLGKEAALTQIDSFLRNRDGRKNAYGMFWVLRVLFEVPSNHFPPVRIGRPYPPPPPDPAKLPRFPIMIVKDIPLLVVRGYDIGGLPEPVMSHVEYFRKYGVVRGQPLAPPATSDGVEQKFLHLWKTAYGDAYAGEALEAIKMQIVRLGLSP